jgi:NAD-dependent SIR2 family protein deacetylase
MGVTKCIKCREYFDEEEIEWVSIDHNHDAPYCVSCSPGLVNPDDYDDDTYDPDTDTVFEDEE